MTVRTTWSAIKAARHLAYKRARRAHELGAKVRELRETRGLSQADLARRMGTTQSVIARIELGGVEPRIDTLDRVCAALDAELVLGLRPHSGAIGSTWTSCTTERMAVSGGHAPLRLAETRRMYACQRYLRIGHRWNA